MPRHWNSSPEQQGTEVQQGACSPAQGFAARYYAIHAVGTRFCPTV